MLIYGVYPTCKHAILCGNSNSSNFWMLLLILSTYAYIWTTSVSNWRPDIQRMQRVWWDMSESVSSLPCHLSTWLQLSTWHRGAQGQMHPYRWMPWWVQLSRHKTPSGYYSAIHSTSFFTTQNVQLKARHTKNVKDVMGHVGTKTQFVL